MMPAEELPASAGAPRAGWEPGRSTPDRGPSPGTLDPADGLMAALAGLLAVGVYLATLYPGLHDVGDAAKFSFVGKVLGTPHAPGYPLYVVVSHLFSYVPWGTLAYRMNALSAVFAGLAVMLTYFVTRRLGAGRTAAAAAALALGFGSAFWSRSLYAKGYTLNAALVSAGMLSLLWWDRTRRLRDLYLAAAIFALSLGNHLIVVALLPALVLFPVLTEPRLSLRPKTIAAVLLIALLGLAQYGFIVLRTRQHAPYLEATASNLSELWQVVTARRFAHEIGGFPTVVLVRNRVPQIARTVGKELGPIGVTLLIVGFVTLVARRPRYAMLFGLAALGVAGLTANMASHEDEGFMLPVFVLLWPVAGLGLDRVSTAPRPRSGWVKTGTAIAVGVALPSTLVVTNYRANDHHADTAEIEYFDALFAALPEKAAIIDDEYRVNMMVRYKLLGEGAAGKRDIRLIGPDRSQIAALREDGFEVIGFDQARAYLRPYGFRFATFGDRSDQDARAALRRRRVFRVKSEPWCADVGNRGWVDIGRAFQPLGRAVVAIDNYRPFESRVTVYAGMEVRPSPTLAGGSGAGSPLLDVEVFSRQDPDAVSRLDQRLTRDGAALPDEIRGAAFVVRVLLSVNDKGAHFSTGLDLGAPVTGALVLALVDLDNPRRASVCSHGLGEVTLWPIGASAVTLTLDSDDAEFSEGWHDVERRPDGLIYRWTTDCATLVVPLDTPPSARVTIDAERLDYAGRPEAAATLVVNGRPLGTRPLPAGPVRLSWDVAQTGWRHGLNQIVLEVAGAMRPAEVGLSPDRRLLGMAVTGIRFDAQPGRSP
ncbi:MAG: DUF2723 domain-containing protein [Acidobacteriota bacterium]